jgi:hypothetical protein
MELALGGARFQFRVAAMYVMPDLSTSVTAVSAAPWCAAAITVVVGPERKPRRLPWLLALTPLPARTISPHIPALAGPVRRTVRRRSARCRFHPRRRFRRLSRPRRLLANFGLLKPLNEASAEHRAQDRAEVCGHRGRRYFHDRPGHLSWRCRR